MQNKMKLKSTIDLVKSYPQMLMKPMWRQVKTRVFLCYASNSIKSQSTFFRRKLQHLGISIKTQNPMNSTYFQERTITPFPSVFDELRRTSIWNWAGQLETGELLSQKKITSLYAAAKGAGMTLLPQSRWFSSTAFFYTRFVQRSHVSSRRSHYPILILDPYGDQVLWHVRRKPRIWKGAVVCR
jgi:hypothetical protein